MSLSRREFLQVLAAAGAAGFPLAGRPAGHGDPYDPPPFGNVSLLHFTDCHAQLLPVYFREPNINIGVGDARGQAPHLVGRYLLERFGIAPDSREAHAFTYLNFEEAARRYGRIGGFAHLATLVKRLRASRPASLLLDGGDTWHGSATALWTRGQDMVGAAKLLGVEVMTGHWEFTYGTDRVREIVDNDLAGNVEFLAHNVMLTDEASFEGKPAFDEDTGMVFRPWTMRELNGVRVGIVGQAFPYTTLANPRYKVPDWSFGIREDQTQAMVDAVRSAGADVVILLSHNGMDVDLKMASRVTGIDAILGGHTHDGMPEPSLVDNPGGRTLVVNSGSNGKFLSVLDLDVRQGRVADYRFRMLPVFADLLEADAEMSAYIEQVREPYLDRLDEVLAVTDTTLYRRGNFAGTFDQIIVDALMQVRDAEIAFSPGFRWGTTLLPGDPITMERLMDQTAITYPKSTLTEMTGEMIKEILEGIADNLFNPDPYYQMGGDMVRVGGLRYTIDPGRTIGNRLSDLELGGKPLDPSRTYRVAGWASVNPQPEELPDIWDVVAEYLRDQRTITHVEPNLPTVEGIGQGPGFEPG
jgi:sulfur-oxidizing protein SoxB